MKHVLVWINSKSFVGLQKNWKEHVDRMSSDRIPKIILKYQPKGKRNVGRPLKRWKDSVLEHP
jgi:hypothetical protein